MFAPLQNIDTYRKNAAEAVRIIQALQEFSNVEDLKELSEMYQDESRLEEAAVSLWKPKLRLHVVPVPRMEALSQPRCWAQGILWLPATHLLRPKHGASPIL